MEEERQDIDVLDCDVYTYNLTHGEDEEEEQEEYNPYHIYKCLNCGFVFHTGDKPEITDGKEDERKHKAEVLNEKYEAPKLDLSLYIVASDTTKFRCPQCARKVPLQEIEEKEYKQIMEKKRQREEEKKKRTDATKLMAAERVFKINMYKFNKELQELTSKLSEDLRTGKIDKYRFVSLFRNLSFNLYKKYEASLKRYNVFLNAGDFNSVSKEISDDVLKANKVQEKTEDIIEEKMLAVENDPMYITLYKKHIIDDPVILLDEEQKENAKDTLAIEEQEQAKQKYNDLKVEEVAKKIRTTEAEAEYRRDLAREQNKTASKKLTDKIKERLGSLSHTFKNSKK